MISFDLIFCYQLIAKGDDVELLLEKGKFMEGLVEGIVGSKAGENRLLTIKFPNRPGGMGAQLSGKEVSGIIDWSMVKLLRVWLNELINWIELNLKWIDYLLIRQYLMWKY